MWCKRHVIRNVLTVPKNLKSDIVFSQSIQLLLTQKILQVKQGQSKAKTCPEMGGTPEQLKLGKECMRSTFEMGNGKSVCLRDFIYYNHWDWCNALGSKASSTTQDIVQTWRRTMKDFRQPKVKIQTWVQLNSVKCIESMYSLELLYECSDDLF